MVHVVQAQLLKGDKPELAELEGVVGVGLVLLEHGADDRGDGQNGQQADGEAHRTEQLVRVVKIRC
ncbi:hypothetical protein D3C85_1707420 [compost metagenome]